jgi:hypothetical protein
VDHGISGAALQGKKSHCQKFLKIEFYYAKKCDPPWVNNNALNKYLLIFIHPILAPRLVEKSTKAKGNKSIGNRILKLNKFNLFNAAPFEKELILFKVLNDYINSYFQWLWSKHTVKLK